MNFKNLLYKLVYRSRSGELTITVFAQKRMDKYQLTDEAIRDAWRWGKIEEASFDSYIQNKKIIKVVRRFNEYTVVIIVHEEEGTHLLTNCWRYKPVNWLKPKVYK